VFKPSKEVNTILTQLGYAARKLWNVANYEKREWSKESGTSFPNWYIQKKELKQHFWFKTYPLSQPKKY
jgi:putative transposase